jgi:hypothetical protein
LVPVILEVQVGIDDKLSKPVEVDGLPDPFQVFLHPEIVPRHAHLNSVNLHMILISDTYQVQPVIENVRDQFLLEFELVIVDGACLWNIL